MNRLIEEISLNAWPALHTVLYDGWVLRFAAGYTRRSNSVNPLYPSTLSLDRKIETCEQAYRSKGLKVIFKLATAVDTGSLEVELEQRGYQIDSPTSVQTLGLETFSPTEPTQSDLEENLSEAWLNNFWRMNNVPAAHHGTMKAMLSSLQGHGCFAILRSEGQVVACGLGVLQYGYMGLFDIVTDPAHRRRGFGRQVVSDLISWGRRCEAHTVYLQVVKSNQPAFTLYEHLGFHEIYYYWYRVKV